MTREKIKQFILGACYILILAIITSEGTAWMISRQYQSVLVQHDYKVIGYLYHNSSELAQAAFTREKSEADYRMGRELLQREGYSEKTPSNLLYEVMEFCKQITWKMMLFFIILYTVLYIIILKKKQRREYIQEMVEETMQRFLNGDTEVQIECRETGSWSNVFRMVNELATMLSTQVEQEKKSKDFLKSMISDISHQLKPR